MNPAREKYYKIVFLISAIYDIILGIIFTFFPSAAFSALNITDKMPSFLGYLSLIGAFLFVIGVAYFLIFLGDLKRNRDLITIGILYKLAYCSIVFYYFAIGNIPHLAFVTIFGFADLIFFILMLECRFYLNKINAV